MSLERRYRRLLWAYPRAYRAQRGAEIVGTYLDLARPGRRSPSPGDAADLLAGGIRQRLRAHGGEAAIAGLQLAATLALSAGAALAGWWLVTMPATPASAWAVQAAFPPHPPQVPASLGPFATLGVFPYAAWVLAALAALLPTAWASRALIAAALGLSAAVVVVGGVMVVGGVTRYLAPPLPTLIPLCCLGVLALARRAPGSRWARLAPVVAMAAVAVLHYLPWQTGWAGYESEGRLRLLGIVLIGGTVAAGLAYRLRRDARGLWAALILLTPAVLLYDLPWTFSLGGYSLWQVAERAAADTAGTVLLGYLATLFASRYRTAGLLATRHQVPSACPACGHPLAPAPPGGPPLSRRPV